MPHNCVDPAELDRRFPNLEAVPEVPLNDLARLKDDALYTAGMEIVQQILEKMAAVGRTKRYKTNEDTKLYKGSKKDYHKKGWPNQAKVNYTGIKAFLVAGEYGASRCRAKWQQVRPTQVS